MKKTERDAAVNLHSSSPSGAQTRREGHRLMMRSSPANQRCQMRCEESVTEEGTPRPPHPPRRPVTCLQEGTIPSTGRLLQVALRPHTPWLVAGNRMLPVAVGLDC